MFKVTDKLILNEIHVFLAESFEKKSIIPFNQIVDMFSKIFQGDIRYIKICPDSLEESLMRIVKLIGNKPTDNFKTSLKVLLVSWYDVVKFEFMKDKTDLSNEAKDKLCFKAALSQYALENIFLPKNKAKVDNFKNEYSQVAPLMAEYYKANDDNPIIKAMIRTKLEDIYSRYSYNFTLPTCCA